MTKVYERVVIQRSYNMIYMLQLHFIIIAFFALSAFLANSHTSFLVFIGAFIGVVFTTIVENIDFINTNILNKITDTTQIIKCYGMPIIGDKQYKLPHSIFIYTYLAVYFLYVFSSNSLWKSINNVFLFMFLISMCVYEGYRISSVCFENVSQKILIIAIPAIIGIIWGVLWPVIIGKKNHYKPGISSADKCQLNPDGSASTKYQCKLQTDGTLLE